MPNKKISLLYLVALLLLSSLAFFSLAAYVFNNGPITPFDNYWSTQIQSWSKPKLTAIVLSITWFGSPTAMIAFLSTISAAQYYFKRTRYAIFIAIATTSGAVMIETTKLYFHRLRPVMTHPIVIEPGFSFPSGHTTLSTCLYGAVIIIIWRQNWPFWLRLLLSSLLLLLMILIGLSRIYLGVHYPTDVLAGLSLGLCCLSACLIAARLKAGP